MRSQLSNGENDYEYDYLDEDVLGRRVCVVPSFKLRLLFGVFIVASVLAISIPNNRKREENMARKYKGAPQYVCPAIPLTAATMTTTTEHDDYSSHIFANYGNNSALIQQITANLTEYTKTFRKLEYMDWNKTYNQVKEGMKHWKVSRYLPNIKTGDSIFESGCGIGLGLLLTVELLQDENIRDLHLYGTDFGGTAATTANGLLDAVLTEAASVGGGKRGAVCTADSTRLSFIPDNSFDFVFAGRISPVLDPWETNATASATTNATIARHREICATKATDWRSQMLYDLALERQSAWYGKWVSEMVRIAKPGVPLAIEQVSDPYCDDQQMDERGGGVPHAFWQEGIATYGWDVDPESIDFESDVLFPDKHRYHVFMRKRRRLAD